MATAQGHVQPRVRGALVAKHIAAGRCTRLHAPLHAPSRTLECEAAAAAVKAAADPPAADAAAIAAASRRG